MRSDGMQKKGIMNVLGQLIKLRDKVISVISSGIGLKIIFYFTVLLLIVFFVEAILTTSDSYWQTVMIFLLGLFLIAFSVAVPIFTEKNP